MPETRATDGRTLFGAEEARPEVFAREPPARWPLAARASIAGLLLAGCACFVAAWLLLGREAGAAKSTASGFMALYGGPAGADQVLGAMHNGVYQGYGGAHVYHPVDPGYGYHPALDQMGHGDAYHGSRPQPGPYGAQAGYGYHHYGHYHTYHHHSSSSYFWWIVLLAVLLVLACYALYRYWQSKK